MAPGNLPASVIKESYLTKADAADLTSCMDRVHQTGHALYLAQSAHDKAKVDLEMLVIRLQQAKDHRK